jgi:drug/metabolite transporter (DMT)-like permease
MTATAVARRADYRRGAWLVIGATLAWSSAGILARALDTDAWTTLFWRSVFAAISLLAYLALRERGQGMRLFRRLGPAGVGMAVCFAGSMITFINALQLTSVAAVLMFQAASPLFAAAMAWLFLRERVGIVKALAILGTLVGVVVIVSGAGGAGGLVGDALSAMMGLTFAGTIVLARAQPGTPTSAALCLSVVMVAVVSAPFAGLPGTLHDFLLLALFGCVQMGLGVVMFTAGVRLIPAADAGLLSVLECVLAPVWVWMMFGEDPGRNTLIGGAIVMISVLVAALSERRVSP